MTREQVDGGCGGEGRETSNKESKWERKEDVHVGNDSGK